MRDPKWSDLVFQQRNWYSCVWLCGDQVVEQHLHNIDAINWFMDAHPVKVFASGGAAWRPRTEIYGNIYDHLDADFTYARPQGRRPLCAGTHRVGEEYPRPGPVY